MKFVRKLTLVPEFPPDVIQIGLKGHFEWCLGPESNRHGISTEGF